MNDKVDGRRFVELLGVQDDKTWRMFEEEQVSHDKDLLLGDEPLQGAEDLKKISLTLIVPTLCVGNSAEDAPRPSRSGRGASGEAFPRRAWERSSEHAP